MARSSQTQDFSSQGRHASSSPATWAKGPLGLIVSLAAVAFVAGLGSSWTQTQPGSWYDRLEQPTWNPPDWLFGPGWALVEIVVLFALVLLTINAFARASRVAAALLVPYALWTGYAFALTRIDRGPELNHARSSARTS